MDKMGARSGDGVFGALQLGQRTIECLALQPRHGLGSGRVPSGVLGFAGVGEGLAAVG